MIATPTEIVDIEYDFSINPTLQRFTQSKKFIRALLGPFGCLRGDALVLTEQGPLPIADLSRPMRVLSWNEKEGKFQFSLSGGSFPKGRDYLYRVLTREGEFVAAGHHRVLGEDGKYQLVRDLSRGDVLSRYSFSRSWKSSLEGQILSPVDGPRFLQKLSGCMGRYVESIRQYGRQFLLGAGICQELSPLSADARISTSPSDMLSVSHRDGLSGRSQLHTHQRQSSGLKQIGDFVSHLSLRNEAGLSSSVVQFFVHILRKALQSPQFLLKFVSRHTAQLLSLCSRSCSSSLSNGAIISITKSDVKESFWDLRVLNTNNYVTVDGTIHHNSGKSSACLMDIVSKASLQTPGRGGIKRVRWAVVRNTYGQLKDTTIRTVLDWLPDEFFGDYHVTNHNYMIDKLIEGVEIELLFRALDRPDHVRNLLSLELTGVWINEYREIPKEIFEAIQGRVRRYPAARDGGCTWAGVIMDSNPPEEKSFYYNLFEKKLPDNAEIFKQPSGLGDYAENLMNLEKNYYKNFAKGKDEEFVKVYCEGKYGYIQEGTPITPEYNDVLHRNLTDLQPFPKIKGLRFWDGGHNPTCILAQIHPISGRLVVYDTIVGSNIGMIQLIRNYVKPLLNEKYSEIGEWYDTGDPALVTRDQSTTELSPVLVIQKELNASFVPGVKDWDTRKQAIKYVLTNQPMLLLSANETKLHEALRGGWQFKKKTDGLVIKDIAVKNIHSHPADAISQGLPTILKLPAPALQTQRRKKKVRKSWLTS